jgi:hypothetical protein
MATPSITNVEAAAGGTVRGRHHPARAARQLGLVRSPTGLHSAHARSVHGPDRPVEGYTGSSRGGARAAGDQPPSTMLSDPDTRRLWGARGNHSPHQHESCPRIGASGGVPNLAGESRRLAGVNRQQRPISLIRFPDRPSTRQRPGTFETGNRRSGAAGDREVARRTPITPDREG